MNLSLKEAKVHFPSRFTMENVPTWALKPHKGRYYAPQYKTDKEWYDNIAEFDGLLVTVNQSWPCGKWLAKPFNKNARNSVYVKFEDETKNYHTDVSPNTLEEDAIAYFVNTSFELGPCGVEDLHTCIGIEYTSGNPPHRHADIKIAEATAWMIEAGCPHCNGPMLDPQTGSMMFDVHDYEGNPTAECNDCGKKSIINLMDHK